MLQVVNRADAGGQASAAGSPSPQTPHPRATDARSRGIKFPISKRHCVEYLIWKKNAGEPMGIDDPLLRSDASSGHLTTRAIQKTFKRCAQKAGLSLSCSIHCLRHTYACFLLKASNWNIRLVQKQLGHARIATTQVYADVMLPDTRKAVDRLYQ